MQFSLKFGLNIYTLKLGKDCHFTLASACCVKLKKKGKNKFFGKNFPKVVIIPKALPLYETSLFYQ